MSAPTLEQLAASVAMALGLFDDRIAQAWRKSNDEEPDSYAPSGSPSYEYLDYDGSNLFDPYWFKRCVMWLLARGDVKFSGDQSFDAAHCYWAQDWVTSKDDVKLRCPAEEFPARAMHALMQEER